MESDLKALTISDRELEQISAIDLAHPFFSLAYRPDRLQSPQKLLSFILSQFFALVVILVLLAPVGIVAVRNSGFSGEDPGGITYFAVLTLGSALVILAIVNIFLYKKMKNFQTFLTFVDEVEKYNQIVESAHLLDRIEAAGNPGVRSSDRRDIVEALTLTRQGLIDSLKTERILRENKNLIGKSYDVFLNLETRLSTLREIAIREEASEYSRLFNQALKIGLSVDREVRKMQQQK